MNSTPFNFSDDIYDDAVSGMAFKQYCNKSFRPTAYDLSFDRVLEEGDVWFVKTDFLLEFFSLLSDKSPRISVVTQHSDYELDDLLMSKKPSCVKKVFGSNTTSGREDAIPIPLGLGPPYCPATPKANDLKNLNTKNHRSKLLYVNFRTSTYPSERELVLKNMKSISESCAGITIAEQSSNLTDIHGYLNELVDHKFCVCPRGNGIDTHRLWESLYCRTIPVVKKLAAHRNFTDLPILFIDDWSEVREDKLHREYDRIMSVNWNYSKLLASWWGKTFKE